VLAIASAANFLTILDLWVVVVAYPELERAFAPTTLSEVSWILNVYTITLAALLVPAGRLADTFGRRRCFLVGLAAFGVASLGCALAPSLSALIVFRALQAIAAAVLMPTSLGFVLSAFDREHRGTAVGVWAAVGAVAASSGPVLGAVLMTRSWRWIFFINVPIVVVAVIAGGCLLPSSFARTRRRVDWLGSVLVFGAMALVCTGLVEASSGPRWRMSAALAAGGVLAVVLVAHVRRHPAPVVAPRLFEANRFKIGAAGIFVYYVGFSGMLLGSTLLVTDAWGFSVLHTALAIAPGPTTASLVSPLSGWVGRRLGFRRTILVAAGLFASAAGWPLLAAPATPAYATVLLPSLICWGLANGLLQPALFAAADAAPPDEVASGSAVLTMARQLGSAFGVALLVAVLHAEHAADLSGLRRVWLVVLATAAMTALVGLGARPVVVNELPVVRTEGSASLSRCLHATSRRSARRRTACS